MGRLTLNVLLSFAQFEREVTGERIRDKIAASKAKGMWMGGMPPIGYEVMDKTLVIHGPSAIVVREIYQTYLILGNVRLLKVDLDGRGLKTPARLSRRDNQSGNLPFTRGHLYRILSNPVYIGQVAHRDIIYPGQHQPIIDQRLWDAVQAQLISNQSGHKGRNDATDAALLSGLVFGEDGEPLVSIHSKKRSNKATSESECKLKYEAEAQSQPEAESTSVFELENNADSNPNRVHDHYKRYRC